MIQFEGKEKEANDHLLAYMDIVQNQWKLNCNSGELATAIHTLQTFIIKHMLQRLNAKDFSDWYD